MTILFASAVDRADDYRQAMAARLPDLGFRIHPDVGPADAIQYALVWSPPPGLLASLPNLRAVFNLGAGVDAILAARDAVPASVPVVRLADAGMAPQMVEWVLHGVLHFQRRFDDYAREQAAGRWTRLPVRPAPRTTVGLMGLGVLGGAVARVLVSLGYAVRGWSRRPKTVPGVETFHGTDGLAPFLAETEILVCLVPLTDETRGLLNAETLRRLPAGAAVINAARGAHIVDADLLALLDAGHLRGAQLDVFEPEPLPNDHPFWRHPRVRLTPHIAAVTKVEPTCDQIADTIRRLERGEPLAHQVDRHAGY
ncbi:glyoxylate/hydroxypyruvate reductase A [Roseospira marina]|uniref:Glyoxylate/hydroxypyruvate reductase A n=1 Tax=Roseospira marina TaxID=140057 RepID=A0A5M6IF97_9PROT|nr:glyoxylate/hydroxypyruvate reductase A [Roseospira marina]KAA5606951.1 glyoxylate/hydroxypyruvate reductase A [Roseospira marina]MBB4312873.1 glyoxylate/hydroxypyruvate reductase A [Roseospira marina]MBB5086354.1 glyoxylate/hydroxypyruvate reductase A [Roseospira marina]